MVYNWSSRLQALLFPPRCHLCGGAGDQGRELCPGCLADLPWLGPSCVRCALPLPAGTGPCATCQQHPPAFDRVVAPFRYAPPLDFLVRRLKFHQDLAMARLLGQLLAEHLAARPGPAPALILPVPLHRRRLAERGYNQTLEIGRELRSALGIPLERHVVRRVKDTAAQSRLPARARRQNLRDAFRLAAPLPLNSRRLAILDDVMTTGSTVNELARLLKAAGAREVEVWVLARAPGGFDAGG